MTTPLSSLIFDRHERPNRATLHTPHGTVRVVWRDIAGDRCWFTPGSTEAKKAALPAITRAEVFAGRDAA
jgi:hypothetical protein